MVIIFSIGFFYGVKNFKVLHSILQRKFVTMVTMQSLVTQELVRNHIDTLGSGLKLSPKFWGLVITEIL